MEKIVETEIGGRKLEIRTGKVARQADAAVLVQYGDTVVLVTAVSKPSEEKRDFLPLLVEYREQSYAAGKIPGGYFKREGKPREREILYSRAIDRSLRPRFPKGMMDEVEIIAYLLSYDMENEGHLLGIIGASAALSISPIPFEGPIGAVRVGYINDEFVINPTNSQISESLFDLLLVGAGDEVHMIEFEGKEVEENLLLDAIKFAQSYINQVINLQEDLKTLVPVEKREPTVLPIPEELKEKIRSQFGDMIRDAMHIAQKKTRQETLSAIHKQVHEALAEEYPESKVEIESALYEIERDAMRKMVLEEGVRIDGRKFDEIRPLSAEIGILPRTHGSALFRRGETQALVVTTLGTSEDVQRLSELDPEEEKRFMLHYNFPPFSVGEIKPLRGPGRREIGHGALAEKAVANLIPSEDEFPYTIRVVSDVLESNGSTSMATVCGASLSLMDAGVPLKTSVAGISIGLVKEGEKFELLTDIMGAEDHYGDMDFKVAGTRNGITAIQLDLKIKGIGLDIIRETFERAKKARYFILDVMDATISSPRKELSKYAPKVAAIWIPREKIGEVIGPGGRTIRKIQEDTDTRIEIEDTTGKVLISGQSAEGVEEAKKRISELVQEVEVGTVYLGKVTRIAPFGAFVEILPGKEGLVHISELANTRVKKVEDILKVGDKVLVKVIDIDELGRIKLSRKAALQGGVKKIKKD